MVFGLKPHRSATFLSATTSMCLANGVCRCCRGQPNGVTSAVYGLSWPQTKGEACVMQQPVVRFPACTKYQGGGGYTG